MQAICAGFKDTPENCDEFLDNIIVDPIGEKEDEN